MKSASWLYNIVVIFLTLVALIFPNYVSAAAEADIIVKVGHSNMASALAFSPDRRYALSGSDDQNIIFWEVATGRELRTISNVHSGKIRSIAFSPDGKYFISVADGESFVVLCELSTAKIVKKYTFEAFGGLGDCFSVTFSPDGQYILAGCGRDVFMWELRTGETRQIFTGHAGYINTVAFSPNGKYAVSGGQDKTIKLWDVVSGKVLTTLSGHSGIINSIAFSFDGRFVVSGSDDKTVKLWDVGTGTLLKTFEGHKSLVKTVALTPTGGYVLSHGFDTLKIWDVSSGKEIKADAGRSSGGFSSAFSRDGSYILIGGVDIKLWKIEPCKEIRKFTTAMKSINGSFSPDAKLALSTLVNTKNVSNFKLWDIDSGKLVDEFSGRTGHALSSIFFSKGQYVLSIGDDNSFKLSDIVSGREIMKFSGHGSYVTSAVLVDGLRYVLSGSDDKTVKLWDVATGRGVRTFRGHNGRVNSVAVSNDGKLAITSSSDKTIKLWELATGKQLRSFLGDVNALAFSPDDRYILAGGQHFLKLWDVKTGNEIKVFSIGKQWVRTVAFSPDGRFILLGNCKLGNNNNVLDLIETRTWQKIKTFTGHTGWINFGVFSSDGESILSGAFDGTMRRWKVSSGKELARFIVFSDGEWIVITPDGYYNASPNGDQHISVRTGTNVYDIENYREGYFRPDLVKIALSGVSLDGYRSISEIKTPPRVEIVDTPLTVFGDELTVKLKLSDTGGGIGDIRMFINGAAVMMDSTRGIKVMDKNHNQEVIRQYRIRLTMGENIIRVIASNADGTMQSNPAEQTVTASFTAPAKPTLHALVIGINEFKNPKLRLQYAVSDAYLFADTLKKNAIGLFDKIHVNSLTTPELTTSGNITVELMKLHKINPGDVFVFFVASHGTVDDGQYFLMTSNVGSTSTAKLKSDALSQNRIKELIANIPATKKVIVLDTCNAGQMGDAIQVALLTRGMSEEAAIKILSRAVGSTILSSSTSSQEALEGYQGHGLFTWVLTEGMKGKADKSHSGFIKTTDLVDYVENEVPEIAEMQFKRKQYPTTSVSGQGFPIGKVK